MTVTGVARLERPAGGALAMWDREQLEVIKTLICPGASDAELALFAQVCRRTGLDPMSRQIYGLMRTQRQQVDGAWTNVKKLSIQTSIDGFRLIAERTGKYAGQLGPQWCGADGVWCDVWLEEDFPSAARIGILRSDWREPMWAVARWESYVQKFTNRETRSEFVSDMWKRMPDVMIAKCAESLGLRRAFPAELSGLYTADEMAQADPEGSPAHREVMAQAIAAVKAARPSPPAAGTGQFRDLPSPEPPRADPRTREELERDYLRLALLAEARGHRRRQEILERRDHLDEQTDTRLEAAILALERWEASLPPVPQDDDDE